MAAFQHITNRTDLREREIQSERERMSQKIAIVDCSLSRRANFSIHVLAAFRYVFTILHQSPEQTFSELVKTSRTQIHLDDVVEPI